MDNFQVVSVGKKLNRFRIFFYSNSFQLGKSLADAGADVAILTPRVHPNNYKRFESEFGVMLHHKGIRHYLAPTNVRLDRYGGSFRLRMFLGEMRALLCEKPDIVVYIGIGPSLLVGVPMRPPIVIFTCWGSSEFQGDKKDIDAKKGWSTIAPLGANCEDRLFRFMARWWGAMDKQTIVRKVDAVAIWHPSGYEELYKQSDISKKVFLITKGVDLQAANTAYPGEHQFDVLFVGGILHRKGIYDLLDAFCIVNKEFPQAVLGIAGSGPPKNIQKLEDRIRKLPVNVCFLGDVPFPRRWSIYKSAKIFAFPSLNDFYNSALLEAMACKLPVVTTQIVDSPIENGITGFIVPPGDINALGERLIWLLKHDKECKQMGRLAQMKVRDWNGVSKEAIEKVFLPLLKK
ncbi:hypothetical protein BEH94_05960 [Candidatus Altiarchaeales archaeon WOR_SM1_SCG]|nr:hypothetical protein BEH94_05960 [Candidatus Altiarchaeales archaeon WOR_SM1_SCG]